MIHGALDLFGGGGDKGGWYPDVIGRRRPFTTRNAEQGIGREYNSAGRMLASMA